MGIMKHCVFLFALLMATALSCAAQPVSAPLLLQTGRLGAASALVGDSVYVFGGYGEAGVLNTAERVDLKAGTVQSVASTLVPRLFATVQADGPFVYICGGAGGIDATDAVTPTTERYDTRTGQVDILAPLPTPRRLAASALMNGKLYVIGGSADTAQTETDIVEVYDIKSGTWTTGPSMPTPRECALAVKDNMIYAIGGYNGHQSIATVEVLDTVRGYWRHLPDMPFVLSAHHAVVDGDNLFTFGDFTHPDRVAAYNFRTQHWKLLTNTGYQPSRHNTAFVWHGTAYVIGGTVTHTGPFLRTVQTLPLPVLEAAAR